MYVKSYPQTFRLQAISSPLPRILNGVMFTQACLRLCSLMADNLNFELSTKKLINYAYFNTDERFIYVV